MQSFLVQDKEICLYTETFGSPGKPAVILIPGAMAPASFWDDAFCRTLSAQFFVIRFDLRDMGYSTHFTPCRPESGHTLSYTIDDMVDDCQLLLDHYQLDSAHVIGHSLGASIAQLFAIRYPQQTLSLIAMSAPLIAAQGLTITETDPVQHQALWSILMGNKMYPDFERGEEEFLRVWRALNGDWPVDETMAFNYSQRIYETETIEPAWNHMAVQENLPDQMSNLQQLTLPIFYLYGEKDILASNPANIAALALSIDAKFCLIPRAGHMFFHKDIWQFLGEEIIAFLNNCR